MSKLRYIPYAVLSAIVLAAGSASAQTWYDAREGRLTDRIEAGRRDGSLTSHEARRLENGMDRIERYERRAESDGTITPQERRRLDHMLDRQGREIHQQRTDRQGYDRDGRNGLGHDGWRNSHWRHDGQHHGWNGHNGSGRDHDGRGWNNHNNGWGHAGINQRQEWQDRRVANGVSNGSITANEQARLDRRETRINNYETRARADGNLSGRERHHLNGMLNNQSRAINHARNNDRVTTPAPTTTARSTTRSGSTRTWGGRNR